MSEGWRRVVMVVRGLAIVWAAGVIVLGAVTDSFSHGNDGILIFAAAAVPALGLWVLAWLIAGFAGRDY